MHHAVPPEEQRGNERGVAKEEDPVPPETAITRFPYGSGKETPLLKSPPLRTGQMSFPISGSSLSIAH